MPQAHLQKPRRALLVLPGAGETGRERLYSRIKLMAAQKGLSPIILDMTRLGIRKGYPPASHIDAVLEDILHACKEIPRDGLIVLGISYGAMVALIAAPRLRPAKIIACSPAIFLENRKPPRGYLTAWRELGTMPDPQAFQQGQIMPATQRVPYSYIRALKKYTVQRTARKISCETQLCVGKLEGPFRLQAEQIFKELKKPKQLRLLKHNHDASDAKYQEEILQIITKGLE